MTVRPHQPCAAPNCPNITTWKYCDDHRQENREKTRKWDKERGTAAQRGYDARWRKGRGQHLREHPLCVDCERMGYHQAANTVDHVIPHRGNMDLFWLYDNWQSLCARCHTRKSLNEDEAGFINDLYPLDLQPSRIPLTIVCGPSGSGKTTYVREQAAPDDIIIDLDQIKARLTGSPWYQGSDAWLDKSIKARNEILRYLGRATEGRAWFIVSAPRKAERAYWQLVLKPAEVIVLAIPLEECRRRLRKDKRRLLQADEYGRYAAEWWSRYQPRQSDTILGKEL